ncbi:MAG: LutB/LldF family L-lactate oxidation iron-sulfur protein, partial [Anaerolineales bacterium]
MPTPFYQKIDQALSDPNLQSALDANAERRINARITAFASLSEDLSILRQRAHNVRLNTIEHLDFYLATFRKKALENGFIIHDARNGEEAVQIVLEIAQQNQAKLIAKSKSMVSEEISLNKALENAGIKVIETDLGEYIVQIRGETPAHIITPAVHLRRADVAKTFHEILGIPYTEVVADLTKAARQVLRQVFLDADIGISGVNFGVAESGLICLLTNEGNGRMVTTLPKVHIALMGIERIVPTMDDLALMLSLLPRSATGQKITVYTSLIRTARQSDEMDGSQERHIILIDNGRLAMRQSPLSEALLCIRCGACLNACPVFREIGGHAYVSRNGVHTPYPGPIGSVISTPLFGYHEFGHLARASSLCGACREACPVDINLPDLLLRIRAGHVSKEKVEKPNAPWALKWGLKIFAFIASHARLFALAQKSLRLFTSMISPNSHWLRIPTWTGWGYGKDFPRPATQTFQDLWKKSSFKINQTDSNNPYNQTNFSMDHPPDKLNHKNIPQPQPADLI